MVPLHEVPETDLLDQQVLESFLLLRNLVLPILNFFLHRIHVLFGSRRQSLPGDFLFFFGNNVHRHENIQGIVDTPTNVLFVEFSVGVFETAFGDDLLDEFVGDLVVGSRFLFFDLLTDHHGKMAQPPCRAGGRRRTSSCGRRPICCCCFIAVGVAVAVAGG